jgi:hypothetical protein
MRAILWNVTPYSPVEAHRRFGGTFCLHLQCRSSVCCLFLTRYMLGSQNGAMFLRNVSELQDYMASYHTIFNICKVFC